MAARSAWSRMRDALRQEIIETAQRLFLEHGFEATTVDDIAEQVGISRRTFFRYFGTKEDVVLGDLQERGDAVARALANRPADEGAWEALRAAMLDSLTETFNDPVADLALARMMKDSPSLRARRFEKRLYWVDTLSPLIAPRLQGANPHYAATTIVSAALSCVDLASDTWADSDGKADMIALYDSAVAALRDSWHS
ncbi:TetR family transcriptional regulator [Streptomyces chartreusis]